MLLEVCKNPRSPGFNHYLFESVAALVRHSAGASAGAGAPMLRQLEEQLFPPFTTVLQQDVQEFHPYVFQVRPQVGDGGHRVYLGAWRQAGVAD